MKWDNIYRTFGEVEKDQGILPNTFIQLLKRSRVVRVLDLGCGTGRHTMFLARNGFQVVAVDSSSKSLEILKKKVFNMSYKFPITIRKESMSRLSVPANSMDAVVCVKTLSHGTPNDILKILRGIKRLLKPNGLLLTDLLSRDDSDFNRKKFKEIEPGTLVGLPFEEKIPHYFVSVRDIKRIFSDFKILNLKKTKVQASTFRNDKQFSIIYQIIAQKDIKAKNKITISGNHANIREWRKNYTKIKKQQTVNS